MYKRQGSGLVTMTDVFKLSSANKSTVTAHIKVGEEWKLILPVSYTHLDVYKRQVLSVCSCRSSKTDTTVHQDNTEQKQTEQEEVSTDKAQVSVNKNVERMIEMMQQMEFNWQKTNYSPPDSTGKQYPTSTETATGTSTKQEKETYNEQIQVQIQEIQETLLTLKEQLEKQEKNDTKVVEKVAYIPPWAKAVIAVFFVVFIIFVYKNVR